MSSHCTTQVFAVTKILISWEINRLIAPQRWTNKVLKSDSSILVWRKPGQIRAKDHTVYVKLWNGCFIFKPKALSRTTTCVHQLTRHVTVSSRDRGKLQDVSSRIMEGMIKVKHAQNCLCCNVIGSNRAEVLNQMLCPEAVQHGFQISGESRCSARQPSNTLEKHFLNTAICKNVQFLWSINGDRYWLNVGERKSNNTEQSMERTRLPYELYKSSVTRGAADFQAWGFFSSTPIGSSPSKHWNKW